MIYAQTLETAEETDKPGPLLELYSKFAAEEKCHVAGAARIREGDNVFNSIVYFGRDGGVTSCIRAGSPLTNGRRASLPV